MSRYFDKLPLLDGFYLVRKFLVSRNQQENLPNANIAIVDNSILTQISPNSSPSVMRRNQGKCVEKQTETAEDHCSKPK